MDTIKGDEGMFYTFYVGTQCNFNDMKEVVKKEIMNIASEDVEIVKEDGNEIEFVCSWFDLNIDDNAKGILFTSEDYRIRLNFLFWFEVYYSDDGISEKKMMELIGKLLRVTIDNGILLSNGDKPILQKKEGKIIVDDSQLDLEERFPFQYLNIEYEEGRLIQV